MTLSIQTHEVGLCVGLETNKKKSFLRNPARAKLSIYEETSGMATLYCLHIIPLKR